MEKIINIMNNRVYFSNPTLTTMPWLNYLAVTDKKRLVLWDVKKIKINKIL